ncbi:tryptophan--tRNA ligase [Wolbachia pipientis]|uniref:Tryptophan--tRNA ligase n=1 Tax=Wolbachia pipientis TaxID=955 RepID=A0A1E7QJP5_WOLPI|nr:tryptophan--tRNA ligase [Wolbachia pipientis]OEY86690.1 tryptophan--tRNA ligase [Wolbachia pipientis]
MIVFTGIQPSGVIHLGNYIGLMKQLIGIQDQYKSFFCIVDLHTITANKLAPNELRGNVFKMVAAHLACGINPEKAVIFNQSIVSGHTELSWLLGCYTPIGWLNRMTQFKDKAGRDKQKASLGLYSYPVLMAADILLYNAQYVPVGDDQKQHLEITRDIASAFNKHYRQDYFVLPEALINSSRVMSLRDGTKKMSKSDPSDYSRINFDDSDKSIINKIKKAKTDSILGFDIDTLSARPEVCNMVNIYSALSDIKVDMLCNTISKYSMERFKKELVDIIISTISPVRKKMTELLSDKDYLLKVLKHGGDKAAGITHQNIKKIKDIIGFVQW